MAFRLFQNFAVMGWVALIGLVFPAPQAHAQEADAADWVSRLSARARPSVVVIQVEGRDGQSQAIGTGFCVDAAGLIATNLHVIGEARPIQVRTSEGQVLPVEAVQASDLRLDLAVLKVGGAGLPALPLAAEDNIEQGEPVLVLGNPQGLEFSVVSGVVSARREIDDRELIQIAVPIEPGNSGGPVLNRKGEVLGIVTLRSAVTDNLGFAVQAGDLKLLLQAPNPVLMKDWLTIGAIDAQRWQTTGGASWRQRGGQMLVRGAGEGFGGRSLCLARENALQLPYEVAVRVKLDDEAGAAGLAFCSDGGDRHYGFYPSAGRLRLTRFDGPTVFEWHVIEERASPHYRPGEWNWLKVRIEADRLRCFVNDHLVIESADAAWRAGLYGLAKFRQTEAGFQQFAAAQNIAPRTPAPETFDRVMKQIESVPGSARRLPEHLAPLAGEPSVTGRVIDAETRRLQGRIRDLENLQADLHVQRVCEALRKTLENDRMPDELFEMALCISWLDNPELDLAACRQSMARLTAEAQAAIPAGADDAQKFAALDRLLFEQRGFHGSRTEYEHPANSHIDRVIDDREGLPITLSVLYLELARRLGLKAEGVGLPGHFVVRRYAGEEPGELVDVFDRGKKMSADDAARKVLAITGEALREDHLAAVDRQVICRRMLQNLLSQAQRREDDEAMLRYLEALAAADPQDASLRGMRAVIRQKAGRYQAALADLDWILEHAPPELPRERIEDLRRRFEREAGAAEGSPE